MINEHDVVILEQDLPGTTFKKGDKATVVHIYPNEEAYELEFFNENGSTLAVETVNAKIAGQEIIKVIWNPPQW
jgi:hypothetical protein